jgi:hypothetical protein
MTLYNALVVTHLVGLIFGMGGVTATDIVSAYGMHVNRECMPRVVFIFKVLTFMVWVGLFLLIVSGAGLWYTSPDLYGENLDSWAFKLKLVLTGVVIVNGLFLTLVVSPAFESSVMLDNYAKTKEFRRATMLGYASGGLSFISWWGAFFLGIYVFRVMG